MINLTEFEKIKNILLLSVGNDYREYLFQHHFNLRASEILEWIDFLKNDLGFFTLVDITSSSKDDEIEVIYQLLNMDNHQRVNLHITLSQGGNLPSIVREFQSADWKERELREMLGVRFSSDMDLLTDKSTKDQEYERPELPRLSFNPNKSEDPYEEESFVWKDFDHLAPETSGHFEWHVCFDPEKVVRSKPFIGIHHRGYEKLFEQKNIFQVLFLIDQLNMASAPTFSSLWAKTLEEIFQLEIPDRAKAMRMIMLEFARINQHLTVMFNLGNLTEFSDSLLFINLREKIYELFEKWTGKRQALSECFIGGVRNDFPQGWIVECQMVLALLSQTLPLIHQSFIGHDKFRDLASGERVEARSILDFGITGPAMRAAGLNFDLRKSHPFYFYQDLDFDIPVGVYGTTYDRYLVRMEEIYQSIRIITQLIDNLPEGKHALFPLSEAHSLSFNSPFLENWHYGFLESPAGEAGVMLKLNADKTLKRVKLKTPSFSLIQGLHVFVRGLKQNQLGLAVASLGLSRWEMDR